MRRTVAQPVRLSDAPRVSTLGHEQIVERNAARIGDRLWASVRESTPAVLALDMSAVLDLEYTALMALTAAEAKLRGAGTTLWLVALNPGVRDVIGRAPLGRTLGADRIFPSLSHAVAAYTRTRVAS